MGFDVVSVLAATDATIIIATDLYRTFYEKGIVDINAAVAFILASMVGEENIRGFHFPPDDEPGRAEILFKALSPKGEWLDRKLVCYTGVDASDFVPDETLQGLDIRYESSGAWFYLWPSSRELVDRMPIGGSIVFRNSDFNEALLKLDGRQDDTPEGLSVRVEVFAGQKQTYNYLELL